MKPSEKDAKGIFLEATGEPAISARRFPTGLCHYVYDVVSESGLNLVVRIASPDSIKLLRGG
jgi:hypothetical protein